MGSDDGAVEFAEPATLRVFLKVEQTNDLLRGLIHNDFLQKNAGAAPGVDSDSIPVIF